MKNVIKRKGDKLYVKRKGHDDLFNNWINKNDMIMRNELFSGTLYSQ